MNIFVIFNIFCILKIAFKITIQVTFKVTIQIIFRIIFGAFFGFLGSLIVFHFLVQLVESVFNLIAITGNIVEKSLIC